MRNCLNPRRSNTYEISETDEQADLPQKLQKRNTSQHQELTDSTDAWWRSPLESENQQKELTFGPTDRRRPPEETEDTWCSVCHGRKFKYYRASD